MMKENLAASLVLALGIGVLIGYLIVAVLDSKRPGLRLSWNVLAKAASGEATMEVSRRGSLG